MADENRNHLKAWREKRGLTQEELADRVGTNKAVISLLENEKRPLSSKWLRKFAEALKTKPGYILDYDPNEINDDIFDIWDRIAAGDRSQAAKVLDTFTRTGTKG
jgi:transcriptional regulator with XRE-family HTH domain